MRGAKDRRFGQGYQLPAELGMVRAIIRTPRLAGGGVVTEGGLVRTNDFDPDSEDTGWGMYGNGRLVANEGVFRGGLEANEISAGELVMASGASMRSSDYSAGNSGWELDGDGNIELNDATIRGTLIVEDEDGYIEVTQSDSGPSVAQIRMANTTDDVIARIRLAEFVLGVFSLDLSVDGGPGLSINYDPTTPHAAISTHGADWLHLNGDTIGFFDGARHGTRQTVSGSRGGNAALESLLDALHAYGLINDSSSA